MAPRWDEIEALSDDQLRQRYDDAAQSTVVGTAFWRDEVAFRSQMRVALEARALNGRIVDLTESLERMTRWLVRLAIVTAVIGILAVVVAIAG